MINLPSRYVIVSAKNGGMSSVVQCNDTRLQRSVMVKYLDPATDQQRLLDEIQALQSIRSEYVVQIYDVISDSAGKIVGVVEEFCEGRDLSDLIGQIDYPQFLKFGYQLISGIAEVHDHGIIHRDIKPHNVRIGNLDRLTLIDFGLARASAGAQTVSAIGTSGFMAPELFRLQPNGSISFTPSIDVFAFASSMFLMAAGGLPATVCQRPPDVKSTPINFANLPFNVHPDLATELNRCHNVSPLGRPSSRDLQSVFKRVLLRGNHRALLNIANNPKYLDKNNRRATAAVQGLASLTISYDDDHFVVSAITGDVFVNAGRIAQGYIFPGSCVIAFGDPTMGNSRQYITFDVSHPGVVL